MTINVRGADYQENLDNDMGLEFYDLSHRWGLGQPCWPYFEDVKIERLHSMAKSGVLTQRNHHRDAFGNPYRRARAMSSKAPRSWTRCRCPTSSARASWCRSPRTGGR